MLTEFRVWTKGFNDEASADYVFGRDTKHAAEVFVEGNHSRLDWPSEVDVMVKESNGNVLAYTVTAESVPVFSAALKKA